MEPRTARTHGRDAELAFFEEVLAGAARGAGSCVLIEAGAGLGKTHLVGAISAEARDRAFETYVGGADRLERSRPFAALAHGLSPLRPDLPSALWDGSPDEEYSTEFAIVERICDVIERRSLDHPVLLVIEDLHWADEATLLFVRSVVRRIDGFAVAVVVTYRPGEATDDTAHVIDRLRRAGAGLVTLGALDERAAHALLVEELGGEPGSILREQANRASGNPLYITELISALRDEGLLRGSEGRVELERAFLPPTLRLMILRRLASLPEATQADLTTASVLGLVFSVVDLAAATGRTSVELLRSLEPALRAGILHDAGDEIAFHHDLVRSALYEAVPRDLIRAMHRSLAHALADAGRPATVVAAHLAEAAEVGDAEAVRWLLRAADEVGLGALGVTAELLGRAAALSGPDDPLREEIMARRIEALAFTFRAAEAEAAARDLLAGDPTPATALRARLALAVALETLGRPQDAHHELEWVLANPLLPAEAVPALTAWNGWMQFQTSDVVAARRGGEQALRDAKASGEPYGLTGSAVLLSHSANASGDAASSVTHGLEAVRHAASAGATPAWSLAISANLTASAELAAGSALIVADRLDEAIIHLNAGRRAAEARQSRVVVLLQMALCAANYYTGAWDDCLAEATTGLALAEDAPQGLLTALGYAARVHLHRGEIDEARAHVDRGLRDLEENGPSFGADLLIWTLGLVSEAEGDVELALTVLEGLWAVTSDYRFLFSTWRCIWPDLVRLAAAAGHRDVVDAVTAWALDGGRLASDIPGALGAAARIKALADDDADSACHAAELYRGSPRVGERAGALEDAGVLVARNDRERGVGYLQEALALYEALGASRDAERITAALGALGVRRGVRGRRQRPTHGWDSLTQTETRIIERVTRGMTNAAIAEQLFISARTVQTHLRNVFRKLGVGSRSELAAMAARRGDTIDA